MKINYAIVFVSDMKRSTDFYRDIIGLPLRYESPGWTEFATKGATLALHVDKETSSSVADVQDERPWLPRHSATAPV